MRYVLYTNAGNVNKLETFVSKAGGEIAGTFTEINNAVDTAGKTSAILVVETIEAIAGISCIDIPVLILEHTGGTALGSTKGKSKISECTKAALAAKKARGAKLGVKGTENLINGNASEKAGAALRLKASEDENNILAIAEIDRLKAAGMNWTGISNHLNDSGLKTSRGNTFTSKTVAQLWEGRQKDKIAN